MGGRANFAADVLSEKQKVFQWMRKWLRENGVDEKNVASFDLPDLIILLQCAGFTLHKFQSDDELSYTNSTSINGDTLKIELTCSKSGMRAEMLKALQSCSCPQKDDIKTEEFFSVTSCSPTTKGSFDVSLSSFLPTITHPKQKVVGDIFKELIEIIKSENEETEPDTQDVRATIERMSLDPTKSLMQNLKDIKRVVDSFLGDKEEEAAEGPSFLRKNMEERVRTQEREEKSFPPPPPEPVEKPKFSSKGKIGAKKPISSSLSRVATASVFANANKSSPVRGMVQGKGAVNKKTAAAAVVVGSSNKSKVGRVAPVSQRSFGPLAGSTNSGASKFGRITRSKKS